MGNTKVHFMGICGSGAAPLAIIAKKMGYDVSGCDLNTESYYSKVLYEHGITVHKGHDIKHLEDVDIVAISPAIYDISPDHEEFIEAKKRGILMTWQEFSSSHIQNEKFLISIAGTHGKSTSTVLMGLVMEMAGVDPIVEAGTTFKKWGGGFRAGDSEYFVCEADEFNNNFLNYNSSIAVINNVEMDHPEFFKGIEDVKDSFKKFIMKLKGPKILVINEDSQILVDIVDELSQFIEDHGVRVIGFYIDKKSDIKLARSYKGKIKRIDGNATIFTAEYNSTILEFELGILGKHNVENALGVLAAALELNIDIDVIREAFKEYKGIGRRLDLVDEINGIKIYDDYAHHPTAVTTTLKTLKEAFPTKNIIAVYEPHQISRTRLFLDEFAQSLGHADGIIVTKPYLGREIKKNLEPLDINTLVNKVPKSASYIEDFDTIPNEVKNIMQGNDIIVVLGAGESYNISRNIAKELRGVK